MDEDALDADAALAALVECAEDDALDRVVDVRILVDDHRGVPAELEYDRLLARASLQVPTDAWRAGEGEQLQAVVLGESRGPVARAGQDRERAFGQVGLGEHLTDHEGPDRRQTRRFQDERTADGEGRRDLVRRQVQGKVEGRDE